MNSYAVTALFGTAMIMLGFLIPESNDVTDVVEQCTEICKPYGIVSVSFSPDSLTCDCLVPDAFEDVCND